MTQDLQKLLGEILLPPSQEILSERFIAEHEQAACNGKCKSGTCIGSF